MNRNIPKRRFKGYTEPWEELILGEVSEILAGGDVNKKKLKKTGEFPVIGNGLVNEGILGYYDFEYRISAPAVTVTGRGDVGFAKARFKNFTPVVRLLVVKYEGNSVFLENSLNLKNVYVESTGVPQLTVPQLGKYIIKIPNLDEQNLIGSFFKNLDKQIDKQGKKVEKLKNLKKAYLSEMFPAEGELSPKRRFKGFTEPWEEKKLEEVTVITMGQSPSSKNYSVNPSDYILVQGNLDMNNGKVIPRIWTCEVTKIAEKYDLLLSVRAPVGDIAITDYNVVIGRGVAAIKGNDYIYQYFVKLKFDNYWKNISSGSTFDSINSEDIRFLKIKIPCEKEQKLIGSFFKKLDDEINLEQKKLEKLKQLKQAYLEEMFV